MSYTGFKRMKNARKALVVLPLVMMTLLLASCACSNNNNDYASEDDAGYIGTWTGKLESTTTGPACYAAQDAPAEITVKNVETTGRMVIDAKVLYHGHLRWDLPGDVDTFQGDKVLTLTDQTVTLENNGFSLKAEEGDGELEIIGTWTGVGESQTLELTVKSEANWNSTVEDVFTLSKQ